MGKKRIIKKSGKGFDQGRKERALGKAVRKRLERGILHVEATFNNTKAVLTDDNGNAVMATSSGALVIRGVGAGRESALRAFAGKGIQIVAIKDATPVPHNGPRAPKPRRV